jgi:hypothetical protein
MTNNYASISKRKRGEKNRENAKERKKDEKKARTASKRVWLQ